MKTTKTLETYGDKMLNFNFARAVTQEHVNQFGKWGYQEHTLPEWLMFIGEELGEVNKAVAEFMYRGGDPKDIYKEAIQTATLLLKLAEFFK